MKRALTAAAVLATANAVYAAPAFHTTTGFASFGFIYGVSNEGTGVATTASEIAIWNPVGGIQTGIGGLAGNGNPGISDDGRYIGGTATGPDGKSEMGRYDRTTSTWTTFGGTGGYSGSARSSAWGISPDGKSVVGFGYGTPTGSGTSTGVHPAVWTEGVGMTDYAFNPTATSTNRIEAASNNGKFAGLARYPSSSSAAVGVYWGAGVGSQQGMSYNGGFLGEANKISVDGRVVGGLGSVLTRDSGPVLASRPYLYDTVTGNTTLINSIAGQNGNAVSSAVASIDGLLTGLTGDAQTAVGFFRGKNSGGTALIDKVWGFIWTSAGGSMSFDLYVLSLGATDTDTYYYVPTAISGDGTVIAGYRYLRSTNAIADSFMITNVPAPATLALFGSPLLFGMRRRR